MATTYSNTPKSGNRTKVQSPENFLEALRSLGSGAVSDFKTQAKAAITQDIPESFGISTSGTLSPNESLPISQMQRAEERGYSQAESEFTQRLSQMRQEERQQLIRSEREAKQQIDSIRQEIRSLVKTMGDFAQEIQVATMQTTVNPGVYHKNFYIHLKTIIVALRQKAESSKNWLAASNHRAKKKGFYWSQVKSSGTKYMLSSERYMVTSTG